MTIDQKSKKTIKKRPSEDDVKGMLLEGNFGSTSNDQSLPMTDPISVSHLVLNLSEVKPCDINPRRATNPKYYDIKNSIRSTKKLKTPLTVTRRPGEDNYMVESGGNTRLKIMNELYLETGDEAFNRLDCFFIPWQSNSILISAHLIENVMRGDMILIDKAYAVQELKQELETEREELISDRNFAQLSEEIGYKISQTHLRRLNYAIKLDEMIPHVLRSGIGAHKLEYIKKVEKAYASFCESRTEQFEPVFMAVMIENDTPEHWDFKSVRKDLDERLSGLINVSAGKISLEIDAIVSKQPLVNDIDSQEQQAEIQQITSTDNTGLTQLPQTDSGKSDTNLSYSESAILPANETTDALSENTQQKPQDTEIKLTRLRENNIDLALKIARPAELEELVMPVKTGLGFFMESPINPITERNLNYFTWWLLFGISEQNTNDQAHYPMWSHSNLYGQHGQDQKNNDDSLVAWISTDPGVMNIMYELLHNEALMSDKVFTFVFRLMENCRIIRRIFSHKDIWEN